LRDSSFQVPCPPRLKVWPLKSQVHGGAQRAFFHAGFGGLAHFQAVEQFRGEHAEVEAAPAVGAAVDVGGAGGGHALDAVDAYPRKARVQAAHGDLLAFAAVAARERYAGHALQRFSQVGVRELGDVLGLDDVDDAVAVLLGVQRAVQAGPEASHDHHVVVRPGFLRLGLGLEGGGQREHGQRHQGGL
jgi:hypothetical protein